MKNMLIKTGICVSVAGVMLVPLLVFGADDFVYLAPLPAPPGFQGDTSSLEGYLTTLFQFAITIGAVLAVIQIVRGGFEYMTTEAVTGKGAARLTIQYALFGLMFLLGSWLILFTINDQIISLDALKNLQGVVDVYNSARGAQTATQKSAQSSFGGSLGGGGGTALADAVLDAMDGQTWYTITTYANGRTFRQEYPSEQTCIEGTSASIIPNSATRSACQKEP